MKKYFLTLLAFFSLFVVRAQNTLHKYEYWFDQDYSGRVTTSISPVTNYQLNASISTNHLNVGLHTISFRFSDSNGKWSSVITSFFIKSNNYSSSSSSLLKYEYWFDDFYSQKTVQNISGQDFILNNALSTSSLTNGLHRFNIRFMDTQGKWSSVVSGFFIRQGNSTGQGSNSLTEAEYWFDHDYANKSIIALNSQPSQTILNSLPTNLIASGLHTINIRFKDSNGKWSATLSQFFIKQGNQNVNGAMGMEKYEYWFDNNYQNKEVVLLNGQPNQTIINNLPTQNLTKGLHVLNLRFMDNNGKWSSTISNFFIKPTQNSAIENLITAYRYWFDEDIQTMRTIYLAVPVNPYNLLTDIDLTRISKGKHYVHFQFKDTLQLWSVATTDTIEKIPLPIAEFSANTTVLCDSGFVIFNNTSVDADKYLWDFGDGTTSTDSAALHFYASPGVYTVSLTVTDTTVGKDSTLVFENYINVSSTPVFSLGGDRSYCGNEYISLSHPIEGLQYSWSTGEDVQSISTNFAGTLSVTGTNSFGCYYADTIQLTHLPYPQVFLGNDTSLCSGNNLVLSAGNTGSVFSWSNGEQTEQILVNSSNTYSVIITDSNNCKGQDQIEVVFNPLPIVNLGNDTNLCYGEVLNLNVACSNCTYQWSNGSLDSYIQVAEADNYGVLVTNEFGCQNADDINVGIIPQVSSSFSYNSNFLEVTFTAIASGGNSYFWDFGDGSTSQDLNPTYQYASNGNYNVCFTVSNDCFSETFCQNIDVVSVGLVTGRNSGGLLLFPNPTNGELNISCSDFNDYQVQVFDGSGKLVKSEGFSNAQNQVKRINLSELTTGIYQLKITDVRSNIQKSARIVKY